MSKFPKEIFKAYDIRGIVGKTLTFEIAQAIGQAIGSEARAREVKAVCIGRDGRLGHGLPGLVDLARGRRAAALDLIESLPGGVRRGEFCAQLPLS